MHLGTPLTVEMALMFLYGKSPKLTTDNIETMMALAEFFLIPSLKAVCVNWLKNEDVTDDNCFILLRVACTYGIELPKCTKYIERSLKVLLEKDEFLEIDHESVAYILDDKKFSYLTMDERLKFLMKWTHLKNMNRKKIGIDLLRYIDFRENSPEFLEDIKSDSMFTDRVLKRKIKQAKLQEQQKHDVILIQKAAAYKTMFWCLDLKREKWFQIKPKALTDHRDAKLRGVLNTEGLIYFADQYNIKSVLCADLEADTCKKLPIVEWENNESYTGYANIAVVEDLCIVSKTNTVTTSKRRKNRRPHLTAKVSTVNIGYVRNEQIEIHPLFTFIGEEFSKICLNNKKAILLLTRSKKLMVYDIDQSKLEIVSVKASYGDQPAASDDGFVVFNENRCICLQRLNGMALTSMYRVKLCQFKNERGRYDTTMFFCYNRWYRYHERSWRFEWATHEEVMMAEKKEVCWKSLPEPPKDSLSRYNLFHLRLSRDRLLCDIDCPHCSSEETPSRTIQRRYTDVYYDYSFVDEAYWENVYDSDYCYYYDSD